MRTIPGLYQRYLRIQSPAAPLSLRFAAQRRKPSKDNLTGCKEPSLGIGMVAAWYIAVLIFRRHLLLGEDKIGFLACLDDFYGSDKNEIGKDGFSLPFINMCDFLKFR